VSELRSAAFDLFNAARVTAQSARPRLESELQKKQGRP
jgi:hypothetical protein